MFTGFPQFSAADLYILKNTSQSINSHIIRNFIKKCVTFI